VSAPISPPTTGEAIIVFSNVAEAQNAVNRYHGGDLNGRRVQVPDFVRPL